MDALSETALAGLIGLAGGVLLGFAARIGRFCTLGALEDGLYASDWRRVRMWALALSLSMAGVFVLEAIGIFDPSTTVYARTVWNPAASIIGGLVFGYGMAIAGNCGYGALARAAGGELRSLVVVMVMGVAAYATLAGPLTHIRLSLFPVERVEPEHAAEGIAHLLGGALGVSPLLIAFAVAAMLAIWALSSADFRRNGGMLFWSGVVAAAIVLGWWGTSHLSQDGFDGTPVESHSFTAPIGESMLFLMISGGEAAGFSVGSVAGVLLGACLGAILQGGVRWEACDDPRELGRQIFGAVLMGFGGVLALGCSVGQGLTAFSTLAISGPVTLAAIALGGAIGLRQLIQGFGWPFSARVRSKAKRG